MAPHKLDLDESPNRNQAGERVVRLTLPPATVYVSGRAIGCEGSLRKTWRHLASSGQGSCVDAAPLMNRMPIKQIVRPASPAGPRMLI